MNRIGIHYAYWTRDWNADFIGILRRAAALGFNAMDFATSDIMALSAPERREIRDAAKELDMVLAFAPATGPEVDIASRDLKIRKYGIDYFKRCIEFTAEMGSGILAGIIYSSWQAKVDGILNDKSDAIARSRDSLAEILPLSADCKVLYCLEVVNRFEQYLLNTTEEGISFVDSLKSPWVKLLLDTFHMNIEEDDMGEAIRAAGNRIGHFHVGECNRKVPGRGAGRMPWPQIFGALSDIDYKGIITMEPFVKMGGEVGKAIAVWRDLVKGGDDILDADARFACNFVRRMIREAVSEKTA
jgi:D-psicose/D-tagatose/L-ribulose 3-epimerase